MTNEEFRRARELFERLADISDPDRREEILDRECGDDVELRRTVEGLLRADGLGTSVLDGKAVEVAGSSLADPVPSSLEGGERRIGPWALDEEIGRGGTSVVFRAHRADAEVDHDVALKVLTIGSLARHGESFLHEQRILARLRHPNIATLIDGGVAEDGTPYVVTELVEGRPIDEHCRTAGLDIRERTELFLTVCDAVSYAHRHLVVHRDVKPGNLFVDDTGQVRLLDFGIAKLLEDQDSTMTVKMLTPAYAAPEQLTGSPVTTATDVFGLGVVLYELLTGERPRGFDTRSPQDEHPPAPPPPPSTAAIGAGIDRDLDRVVRKAIHPDPQYRYANAQSLGDDLRRWLDRRPVEAGPDAISYRVRMFVRRHRLAVAAGVVAFVGLLIGGSLALWQARVAREESRRARVAALQAEQEARRADRVRDFLVETFSAADPFATRGSEVTAREIIEAGVDRIEGELVEDPRDRLRLLTVLGEVSFNLGDIDRSEDLLGEVLASLERLSPEEQVKTLRVAAHSASVAGDFGLAEERYGRALELARSFGIEEQTIDVPIALAIHFVDSHQPDRAREALEALLDRPDFEARASVIQQARATMTLAEALRQIGEFEPAATWGRRAVDLLENRGEQDLELAASQAILAGIETSLGRLDAALALEGEALEIRRRIYGEEHPVTLISENNLATLLKNTGRFEESAGILEGVLAVQRSALGADHHHIATTLFNLGEALLLAGRPHEAVESYREASSVLRKATEGNDPRLGVFQAILGRALARAGRPEEARERFLEGIATLETTLGPDHPLTARILVEHAAFLNDLGEHSAAAERIDQAGPVIAAAYGEESRYGALTALQEGRALVGQGRERDGAARIAAALEILSRSPYRAQYASEIRVAETTLDRLDIS